ncbi:MAG TPA: ABC transporter permease [Gallionellaceae bacterium]|nr:ABC transporter permease [Gallionellaceae bacterium]
MKSPQLHALLKTLLKELALAVLLLFGVSLVVFAILYAAPGDPFSVLLEGQLPGEQLPSEKMLDGVHGALGVAPSWYGQYLSWLHNLLSGNLGTSVRTGLPVAGELLHVSLNTLYLTLGSMLVTLFIAVPIAMYASMRGQRVAISWPLTMLGYVFSALPVFWLAYLVIYVSVHGFGVFPLAGSSGSWLVSLVPVLVLGLGSGTISEVIRHLREEMSRVLNEDYIRTARAKGASVWRHAFKEGLLLPVSTIFAAKIPFILGGAVIVEQIFNWPGMGRMAWQAAQDRDFAVIMGISLMAALFVRLGSLVQRLIQAAVNPH